MEEIDYVVPLIVSAISIILLFVFYLYKTGNPVVMKLISSWYMKTRYSRATPTKDTRNEDAILLIILVIFMLSFGLKLIGFAVVVSDSMKPQFQRGDMVLNQAIFKEPRIGDIITFNAEGVTTTVTHRVVGINSNSVRTKGDNNPLADDYRTINKDIVGKAVMIDGRPVVIPGIGSYFILDFSKEGRLAKFGDQYEFLQKMFLTIRTWGYVITLIAFSALIMTMFGNRK